MQAGAIVVGTRPERSLGRREGAAGDEDTQRLVEEMWGPIDGTAVTEHRAGKGRVVWGQPLPALLQSLALPPDFEYTSRSGDAPLVYVHRRSSGDGPDTENAYFVANQRRTTEEVLCTFRVSNRQPELWDPVTGDHGPCALHALDGDRVRASLQLAPSGSVFVVFRDPTPARRITAITKGPDTIVNTTPFPAKLRVLHPDVTDTFTIGVWVKPENNVMLSTEGFMEHVQDPVDRWVRGLPSGG